MTPEQWRRIEALYHAAREHAEPDRHAFLAEACAGDDLVQREVESLLAQSASAAGVLDGPAVAVAARMVTDVGGSVMTGRRIGAYQLQARLGAGGMGEVYRARDTKLRRDVAIKILPRAFTSDPERLARFDREARMLAALNHPHIGAIYGLEDVDDVAALVLELVEGETLAERLAHGPLPVAEALSVARQIADALNAAHEKGIVHRDLKPANIKITPEGVVKVLDFGLAKVLAGESAGPDLTQSPTITSGGTREGAILGTAAYMSPEQARGLAVDKRTDIWAFGCVLFEMLTGAAAFPGETVSDTFAAILEHEPAWGTLPAATSPTVRRLLQRCLDKDSKRRLRDIGDARMDLDEALLGNSAAGAVASQVTKRAWLPWAVAAAFFVVSAALAGVMFFGAKAPEEAKITFSVETPSTYSTPAFSLSPDGKNLAAVASSETAQQMLWVRALDHPDGRILPGTESAVATPFWSPDGRFIGFLADGKLKKVDISGVPPQTLCDVRTPGVGTVEGGTWNRDDVILFANGFGPVYRVSASGGTPVQVTELDQSRQEQTHRFPMFLPDGRHFLYTAISSKPGESAIYVASLDSKARKRLTIRKSEGFGVLQFSKAVFALPGHLLFNLAGTLMAQRFDPVGMELKGDPLPVAEGVLTNSFTASETGIVSYRAGVSGVVVSRLEWLDRTGRKLAEVGEPARYSSPALSPDLQRVAVSREDEARDIWIFDLGRGRKSRFTFHEALDSDPLWSPDGSRIVFRSMRDGRNRLYQKSSAGSDQETLLLESNYYLQLTDWSPDGRFLLYAEARPSTSWDLFVLPLAGDRKPEPVIQTPFSEQQARFSPDGRWIAYVSDESGRTEVWVQSFPVSGSKWQISTTTGVQPMWRGDGKELLFHTLYGEVIAVPITTSSDRAFEADVPQRLFRANPAILRYSRGGWSVTPDGQRFLMANVAGASNVAPITVVVNWDQGQRQGPGR